MIFIIIIAISFISYKIINLLVSVGQPQIFFKYIFYTFDNFTNVSNYSNFY